MRYLILSVALLACGGDSFAPELAAGAPSAGQAGKAEGGAGVAQAGAPQAGAPQAGKGGADMMSGQGGIPQAGAGGTGTGGAPPVAGGGQGGTPETGGAGAAGKPPCVTRDDCGSDEACGLDPATLYQTRTCVPNDGADWNGCHAPIAGCANTCCFGYKVAGTDEKNYLCTPRCQVDDDCPSGTTCQYGSGWKGECHGNPNVKTCKPE